MRLALAGWVVFLLGIFTHKTLHSYKLFFLKPFTVFDLDSSEERGGSSLSNSMEARFAVQLYQNLTKEFGIFVSTSKVRVREIKFQQSIRIRVYVYLLNLLQLFTEGINHHPICPASSASSKNIFSGFRLRISPIGWNSHSRFVSGARSKHCYFFLRQSCR